MIFPIEALSSEAPTLPPAVYIPKNFARFDSGDFERSQGGRPARCWPAVVFRRERIPKFHLVQEYQGRSRCATLTIQLVQKIAQAMLVYNYDGDVYASDGARMLAEMRDWTFQLGNVHKDSRRSLFTSDAALNMFEASCNQSLAGRSDCAFQPSLLSTSPCL